MSDLRSPTAPAAQAQQPQYSPRRVKMMMFALYAFVLLGGFGSFKFIPMQGAIMEFFNIQEAAYGVLNTAAGWVSVFCAVPLGFLVRKLPCNWSIIIGIAIAIFGIVIQIMTHSFVVFVIARMIEGAGHSFTTLVTGSLTLNLVPREKAAFWGCISVMVSTVPQIVMTRGGTALLQNSGLTFQTIFIFIIGIYILSAVIWVALVPFSVHAFGVGSSARPTREQTIRVMKNKSNVLVALANIAFTMASITWTTYIIRYLNVIKGLEMTKAAKLYSYTTMLGMVSMVVFGIISTKLGTKRKIAVMSFFAGAVAFVLLGVLPGNLIILYVLLWGTLPRSVAGLTNASAADIAEVPSDVPVVNSVKSTIMQIGNIIGGIGMGVLIQYMGYQFTIYVIAGLLVAGAVCWIFAKRIP